MLLHGMSDRATYALQIDHSIEVEEEERNCLKEGQTDLRYEEHLAFFSLEFHFSA